MRCGFLDSFVVCTLLLAGGFPLPAQDIRIRLINGKSGRPVPGECLNVSFGGGHGADLLAATNGDGVLVLHLEKGEIWTDPVTPKACNGMAYGTRKAIPKGAWSLAFLPNWQISCEERSSRVPGEPVVPDDLVRSYSIQKILDSGLTTANTCGKVRMKANPGEAILFVRPPTLREAFSR